jgi:cytochrome c553
MRALLLVLAALSAAIACAFEEALKRELATKDVWSTSSCAGCHGQTGMGGMASPLVKTQLEYDHFLKVVREGKGMMPATPVSQLSDEAVARIYQQLQEMPYDPTQIPIAFKVGEWLTTANTFRIFLVVFAVALLIGLFRLVPWIRCSGIHRLWPDVVKFGRFRGAAIVLRSLVMDGLLVRSLWKAGRFRWLMHAMMLYGFLGLILADVLISVYNPTRGDLPVLSPLNVLPMVSGGLLMFGVFYVMYRYRTDDYIDNGFTLGGDFLFVNFLFHTVLSGFLTSLVNYMGLMAWVMPIYIYHLAAIAALILTGPFTRFQHAWVVPIMVSITRLTEAVTGSRVNLAFDREPSPGRHHKSEAIAASVLSSLGEDSTPGKFKLRYYP